MASSLINVTINAQVQNMTHVTALQQNLILVGKAAEQARQQMDFKDFVNTCSSLVVCTDGVLNSMSPLTQEFEAFDTAMREANTMAGKGAEGLQQLKGQVTELSKVVPMTREALANGLYQAISNGVPEDNWISFLEASAKASVGGLADLGGVVTVTSTIIKNYGLAWEDAAAIQDKIQTTAKNGVTSFEQLQQALPKVTGNAATLGVTIDELMASFATLTGVSGNTSEVATQMGAIFTALVKPSSQAAKLAQEMGIQFDAAAIKAAGGMQNFLMQLDTAVKQYSAASGELEQEVYGKLFGSAEALRAMGPLTGQLADQYAANVEAMKGSTRAIEQAFGEMADSAGSKLQLMKNKMSNFADSIGSVVSKCKPTIEMVGNLTRVGSGIAGMGRTAMEAGKKVVALAQSIRTAGLAAQVFGVTLRTALITSGIGIAIVGITAAMASFGSATEAATKQAKALKEATDGVGATIRGAYSTALGSAGAEIDMQARKLKTLMDSHQSTAGAVEELNGKYGTLFGTFKTAAEWYDTLTTKARDYVEAQAYQGMALTAFQTKNNAEGEQRDLESQRDAVKKQIDALKKAGKYDRAQVQVGMGTVFTNQAVRELTPQAKELQKQLDDLNGQIEVKAAEAKKASTEYDKAISGMTEAQLRIKATDPPKTDPTATATITPAADLAAQANDKLAASIAKASEELQALADSTTGGAYDRIASSASAAALSTASLVKAVQNSAMLDTIAGCDLALQKLRLTQQTASGENLEAINKEIKAIEEKRRALQSLGVEDDDKDDYDDKKQKKAPVLGSIQKGWGDIKGIASSVETLGKVADEAASPWERLTSAIDGALGVMQGIAGIIDLMKELGIIAPATAAAEAASSQVIVQAKEQETNANLQAAASGFMSAHSWIPFVGIGLAAAAVGVMLATMGGLPKFANGGIAYGPTLGLFGEYPGAKTDPEVVAPLSRLRALLGEGSAGGGRGKVSEFKLRSRTLVAAADGERRLSARLK